MSHRFTLLLFALLVSAIPELASAQQTLFYTYSPHGPLTFKSVGYQKYNFSITIHNEESRTNGLTLQLSGDKSFKFGTTTDESVFITLEPKASKTVYLNYQCSPGNVSHATLLLHRMYKDGSQIELTGLDSSGGDTSWIIEDTSIRSMGKFYDRPDSAVVKIQNHHYIPIQLETSIVGDHFSVDGTLSKTIVANSDERVVVRYNSSDALRAEASLKITDGKVTRLIPLRAQRSEWSTDYSEYFLGKYYRMPDSASVTVRNTSNAPVTFTAMIANPAFTIKGPATRTLQPHTVDWVIVDWDKNVADPTEGVLTLTDNVNIFNVALHANGRSEPGDSVIVSGYDLGTISLGDSVCSILRVTNRASSPVTIKQAALSGDQRFKFAGPSNFPIVLQPNASSEWQVCFVAPTNSWSDARTSFELRFDIGGNYYARTLPVTVAWAPCYSVNYSGYFGPLKRWESRIDTVAITSYRNFPITISDVAIEGRGHFNLLTQTPITIQPYDSAFFRIQWDAIGEVTQRAKLRLTSDCLDDTLDLRGHIATPIFGGQSTPLWYGGDTNHREIIYHFFNDRPDSISVLSVRLAQGTHFKITNLYPTPPFRLAKDKWFLVGVTFDGSATVTDDTLIIDAKDDLTSIRFPIDMRGTSGVRPMNRSTVSVKVTPNPAHGPLTISVSNGTVSSITLLDLLGNTIRSVEPNDAMLDTHSLAKGVYYLRINGLDNVGSPFILTRQLILR